MTNNVTDRKLLKSIYETYYYDFCNYDTENPAWKNYNYVPIDCERIGNKLGLDKAIVFGRLYYHLEKRHSYKQENGAYVHFFHINLEGDKHVIHFPLMSAVLAEMSETYYRFTLPLLISGGALALSIAAFIWGT